MKNSKSGRTILCTWEMGGDLGHIARLSRITKVLEGEGHRVVLALKDLSRTYAFFKETQARLIQSPNWLLQLKMRRPIACQADALLLSGYIDTDALLMLTKAWQTIARLVQPDAVIFDYSPTAQLALRNETGITKTIVGTGFSVPEAGHKIIDWRHYETSDNMVEKQEQVALHSINKVLKELNKPALQQLSELWGADNIVLNEFPPFDPYHETRTNAIYCPKEIAENSFTPVVFPNTGRKRILAYLKSGYPKIEQLIQALALSNSDVFVVCPMLPDNIIEPYLSDHFKYSSKLVNLAEGLKQADLFVGHGNATSVKEALMLEVPIIALPMQQEQLLTGKTLHELGAGVLVMEIESPAKLSKTFDNALNEKSLRSAIKGIKQHCKGYGQTMAGIIKQCVA